MTDWTGKTLGRVQINDLVARGGMAEIYTGIHETHGLIAVKVMRGLLERDEHQLLRFKREAEVVGDLRHPHIVRVLDFTIVDETPCIVMDYIPGPSLADYMKALYLRNQRIPMSITARILHSVASALDYAHDQGMIHRDVKPANIMLRSRTEDITPERPLPPDVDPILTDFGLVRLLDSTMHTTTGSVSGTPTYMSPQQARGEPVDKRTDIYSLGIVLYEMLAGDVPFQADTTFGMLMKHINEPPPPIVGISPDLQALMDRALAKDPNLRYDSAGEMANEFLAIFNGQTVSPGTFHMAKLARKATKDRTAKDSSQPPIRFRWLRVIAEIGAAFLLAFLIFRFVSPTTASTPPAVISPDPNISVGRLRFGDFSNVMDEIRLTLNNASLPDEDYHYDAWLIGNDNVSTRKIGNITFNSAGVGQLSLIDPNQGNILAEFNQITITKEPNDTDSNEPNGEVLYSSVFPPNALVPIKSLLVSNNMTPEELALIQGLWYYSGSYIEISINGYSVQPDEKVVGLKEAFESGDESTVRKRTEEIINQIVGASSDQYLDYDGDGEVSDTTDGFGSYSNGDSPGYLQETLLQIQQAMDANDSTPNIRTSGENAGVCIQNMDVRLQRILELTLQLKDTKFGPEMEPIITELETLGGALVRGTDADGDGLIEPIPDECGADSAYEFAYNMADMPLFPGESRVPPSGK